MTNPADDAPTLPGLEQASPPRPGAGELEKAVKRQLDKLRDLSYIEEHHAGLVQLALSAARDVDRSEGRGAPSGRANLLRVMNEILAAVPQPEAASKDALDAVLDAMRHDEDADEVIIYEHGVSERTRP